MRLLALGLVVLFGCGSGPTGGDDTEPPPSTLEVRLSSPTIRWVDGVADTPAVSAVLIAPDGTETDVTAATQFDVFPVELATVSSATLVASGAAAGPGTVSALLDGQAAAASFEVFVSETVTGTADPAVPGLFATATADPAQALTVVYPPAGALVPPNLGEMDVHWTDPAGKDVYEVTLTGGYVTLTTYVAALGASTWRTLAAAHWTRLSSGASGVDLQIRVRGLATAAPSTYIEGTQQLRIAAEPVKGGVYYWNTSQAAVMRFDMTAPAVAPERFYPQAGQSGCVGCHAVSRDGTVVAYRREGGNLNYGNALKVEGLQKQLPDNTQQWNFAAIHPNNADLFTTTTTGLHRTDLATGQTTPLYTSSRIAHPDVAPDGTAIVATALTAGDEVWTSAARLVVFDYDATAKTVGAPRTLVAQAGGSFPYYPSFSPDNAWVLFNRATGGTSYDNPNAELWVTKADGSGTPIRLAAAEVTGTYNSWPKWTPFVSLEPTAAATEQVLWFTFATRRPFGVRSGASQKPQLWLAPFYPERAAAGQPATGPAIRLPFQSLAEGNHIAQWTEAIVTLE